MDRNGILASALLLSFASVGVLAQNGEYPGARGDTSNAPPAGQTTGPEDTGTAAGAAAAGGAEPFERLDGNSDGVITRQEARQHNLYQQFSQADTDGDGKITQAEYRAWAQTGAGAAGGGEQQRERTPGSSSDEPLRLPPGQRPPRD